MTHDGFHKELYVEGKSSWADRRARGQTSEGEAGETDGEASQILIGEGNRAATIHKNAVETGISNMEKTEIISGIEEDSIVVNTWTSQLYEGAQVQVLPAEG